MTATVDDPRGKIRSPRCDAVDAWTNCTAGLCGSHALFAGEHDMPPAPKGWFVA